MPYVLIVGRPNVGKSSLFNILVGRKMSIVAKEANTTRDIVEYDVVDEEGVQMYTLADSGGLNITSKESILHDVNKRVAKQVAKADLVLLVVEYNVLSDVDEHIFRMLRKSKKQVYVIANKADNFTRTQEIYHLLSLGIQEHELFPVSCSHKLGIPELKAAIWDYLEGRHHLDGRQNQNDEIKVAIIGRPNVGKSSLLNAIVGEDRAMVHDEAGTTRDATDTILEHDAHTIRLIDTAGLRKPGKIGTQTIESWSALRTETAIDRCDICAVVLDPIEGVTQNDKYIVGKALEKHKGIILVVNKWDLARQLSSLSPGDHEKRYTAYLQKHFPFTPWAMTVFCSARERTNVVEVLEHSIGIDAQRKKRIPTAKFNAFLEEMVHQHPPRGKRIAHAPRVYYGSHVDIQPPRFVIFVNNVQHIHFSWRRYLENKIREFFGFYGTSIDIEYRGKRKEDNPYAKKPEGRNQK